MILCPHLSQGDNLTSVFGNFSPETDSRTEAFRRPSKTTTKASSSEDSSCEDENLKILDTSGTSLTEEINLAIDTANEIESKQIVEKEQEKATT